MTTPSPKNSSEKREGRESRGPLPTFVADRILNQILSGELATGDALPAETELAKQFNVSRPVVRNALGQLSALSVIDVRQGRPAQVVGVSSAPLTDFYRMATSTTPNGLREIVEFRRGIEMEIASLAAERATSEDLAKITGLFGDLVANVNTEEPWIECDLAFHLAIAAAAKNNIMRMTLESLVGPIRSVMTRIHTRHHHREPQKTIQRHVAILEALVARDPVRSRAAVADHFVAMGEVVSELEAGDDPPSAHPEIWR